VDPIILNIAKRAKVSASTAYRILSGRTKGLRRDAAQRAEIVKKAAKELGYRPSLVARGLAMQRSFCIGFIGTEMDNPVRSKLIEELRTMTAEKGFNFLVSGVNYGDDLISTVDIMLAHRVDGLIVTHGHEFPEARLLKLMADGIPIVSFGQDTNLKWDNVTINYAQMVYELTSHLIKEHGVKKIAFAGPSKPYPRYLGFQSAIREMEMETQTEPERWGTDRYSMEDGRRLALKMINSGSRPDAIVCHNDLLAIGIMFGLRELGIRIPNDIAVVGLDNIEVASFLNPSLTTAGVDSGHLARNLFKLLFDRLEGDRGMSSIELECPRQLIFRESCGCKKIKQE